MGLACHLYTCTRVHSRAHTHTHTHTVRGRGLEWTLDGGKKGWQWEQKGVLAVSQAHPPSPAPESPRALAEARAAPRCPPPAPAPLDSHGLGDFSRAWTSPRPQMPFQPQLRFLESAARFRFLRPGLRSWLKAKATRCWSLMPLKSSLS